MTQMENVLNETPDSPAPVAVLPDAPAQSVTKPIIDLDGLSVTFGARPILRDLRGELRGRAIGLLGPNGAGKTTLIHTLLGFHPPSAGTAHIFGRDIRNDAKQIRTLIGYMPNAVPSIANRTAVLLVGLMTSP